MYTRTKKSKSLKWLFCMTMNIIEIEYPNQIWEHFEIFCDSFGIRIEDCCLAGVGKNGVIIKRHIFSIINGWLRNYLIVHVNSLPGTFLLVFLHRIGFLVWITNVDQYQLRLKIRKTVLPL